MNAADLRGCLHDLLALWFERGLDRERGGYHGRLSHVLEPVPDPQRRLLVHARLIWSFCEGARLGAGDWARAAAEHGYAFLMERFLDPHHGGFHLTLDPDGRPLDTRKDLYAHAFAIFALVQLAAVLGRREAMAQARALLGLLCERLTSPAGGFFEAAGRDWTPLEGARRQNPHMHLLEALLALEAHEPDPLARALADEIFALCADRFVDRLQGCLGEHFDARWGLLPDSAGREVEPGHHFEWVWLLHGYARARASAEALQLAELLFRFARRHGVDTDGLVFDALERSGRVRRGSKRLWPQTEHLKALAAQGEADLLRAASARVVAAYVDPATGAWREQLDRAGRLTSSAYSATSVYHVVLALREAAVPLER